jgi:hypothetical protein
MPATDGALAKDINNFTAMGVYVPGTGTVSMQGGTASLDATGEPYATGVFRLEDGQSTLLVNVVAFHNGDNQSLSGSGGSILTSGVAQVLNLIGNGDRQRETGLDGVSAQGVTTGSAQFAQQFMTTVPVTGTITAGQTSVATVTPASMVGVQVGSVVTVDVGGSAENALITALPSASTATLVPMNGAPNAPAWKSNHTPSYQITGFVYNQERDAAGELDGASGKGTAVAAEYEYNGGGPGTASYDRARNLQGKGLQTAAISSGGTTNSTSMVLASVPGLTAGQQITLSGGGATEIVYVAINYVAASTTVPIQSGIVNGTQTTATWSAFAAQGPDVNEFLIDGEGTEFISLYNPATKRGNLLHGIAGAMNTAVGGRLTVAIPAGTAANTVVKASAGRCCRILVTATGTNPLQVFDNASTNAGTIVAALPASPAIGSYDFQLPSALGITVAGNAANPAVTIGYY